MAARLILEKYFALVSFFRACVWMDLKKILWMA